MNSCFPNIEQKIDALASYHKILMSDVKPGKAAPSYRKLLMEVSKLCSLERKHVMDYVKASSTSSKPKPKIILPSKIVAADDPVTPANSAEDSDSEELPAEPPVLVRSKRGRKKADA